MNDRDRLMGVHQAPRKQSRPKWLVVSIAIMVIAAIAITAYFAGRSAKPPLVQPAPTSAPRPTASIANSGSVDPQTDPLEQRSEQERAAPAITLSQIEDLDVAKIEPGAGCSFSVDDGYYLLTNFDQALIKIGREATVHNLTDDAGKRLFEGASRFSVGKYLVDIERRGPEEQLYEGSVVPATLIITEGSARGELTGIWGCGA